ncbi:MAG TPA: SDR family NAD(P)-dependent oxidoreductase [Candidatus Deferrimicrobiaceae bacterium]|jgi:NAD(P)-dependent dehydrogenase (short-subunit alcohol dehydrogenase family)
MSFKDKVAIVTGASNGIGRAIALEFASKGAGVVVNGRNAEKVQAVVEAIRRNGGTALGVSADVSKKDQVERLVQSTLGNFGRIDVLVNNAGGDSKTRTVEGLPEAEWDQVVDNNLKSVFLVSQAVIPTLKRQKSGRIINISSQAGRALTILAGPHYAAAKAGVIGFGKQLAKELSPHGINVNTVAPGIINSSERLEAVWESFPAESRKRFLEDIPLGRLGDNREIVATVLFLASEGAGYITGATIDVNGGRWML